jgi:hypothetical protein
MMTLRLDLMPPVWRMALADCADDSSMPTAPATTGTASQLKKKKKNHWRTCTSHSFFQDTTIRGGKRNLEFIDDIS